MTGSREHLLRGVCFIILWFVVSGQHSGGDENINYDMEMEMDEISSGQHSGGDENINYEMEMEMDEISFDNPDMEMEMDEISSGEHSGGDENINYGQHSGGDENINYGTTEDNVMGNNKEYTESTGSQWTRLLAGPTGTTGNNVMENFEVNLDSEMKFLAEPIGTTGNNVMGNTYSESTGRQWTRLLAGPTGYKKCHLQYSNKELEECEKSMNQNAFCNLLKQNARIQETSCQRNNTNITVQQIAKNLTQILKHTILNNMTVSELRSAVSSIVETVETSLLVTFSKYPKNENISTPELEVQMKAAIDICNGEETSITLTVLESTMQVPCTHVSGDRDGAIFISYKALESKLNASLLGALGKSDKDGEEINSPIISGAITSPNTAYLEPPVVFYLKQLKVVPPSFILQCVFLDTELKSWSSRGCETKKSDRVNNTLCVCNHLSTFAVLMAPGDIQEDYGLVLISRIGLSVSLVCLCLSFLTFILCRSIKNAHTSILTALCGCLFLGQLLALFGLNQTGNQVLCAVIAGLLQFSFLCAFCWMSLESALLFMTVRNLQAMNYMTSQRQLFPYVCIAGFGIPVIIIIISAAMRPGSYGTEKYCWLKKYLIWSFLGPVCLFIIINFILLVLTFVLLKKKLASLNKNISTLKHTRLLTFKALSQLFILGCTWIIGIFQFGSGSLVMSYIFTICNSLQGLYIFCVHCLLNHQVREEYRRGFRRFQSKKSDSEATIGSMVPMTVKSQSQASEVPNLEEKSARDVENQCKL